jgi:hypothetical protein
MAEKQAAKVHGQGGKASSPERQARLEKALRDNLKRRKDQARDKKQAQDGGASPRAQIKG